MRNFDVLVSTDVSKSARVRQVCAMFDAPIQRKAELRFKGALDIDEQPWNIGLFVGPSGSGKTQISSNLFPEAIAYRNEWKEASMIDDFDSNSSVESIADACMSVGFNTIPAWTRPYRVLSNGEQFRADIARLLLECPHDPIVVDEFTSVVDRQVARIACHAIQKYIRRTDKRFVGVTCHHDIVDWLQPDWIYDTAAKRFERRSLRRRPSLEVDIRRVRYDAWGLFAPFHYMTSELNKCAKCYMLSVNDQPAAFAGMIPYPHPHVKNIRRLSRLVTLPDFQGIGLAFVLVDAIAAAHQSLGYRMRCYPAHPALVRSYAKSPLWYQVKEAGTFSHAKNQQNINIYKQRPCAIFEWKQTNEPMERELAVKLLDDQLMTKGPKRANAPRFSRRKRK